MQKDGPMRSVGEPEMEMVSPRFWGWVQWNAASQYGTGAEKNTESKAVKNQANADRERSKTDIAVLYIEGITIKKF